MLRAARKLWWPEWLRGPSGQRVWLLISLTAGRQSGFPGGRKGPNLFSSPTCCPSKFPQVFSLGKAALMFISSSSSFRSAAQEKQSLKRFLGEFAAEIAQWKKIRLLSSLLHRGGLFFPPWKKKTPSFRTRELNFSPRNLIYFLNLNLGSFGAQFWGSSKQADRKQDPSWIWGSWGHPVSCPPPMPHHLLQ